MKKQFLIKQENKFKKWFKKLDFKIKLIILNRFDDIEIEGKFGDVSPVGEKVFEMRFYIGPGYRIYYGLKNNKLVIIMSGGDKKTQNADIKEAKKIWKKIEKEY
jgi:putative addiction module killer protein